MLKNYKPENHFFSYYFILVFEWNEPLINVYDIYDLYIEGKNTVITASKSLLNHLSNKKVRKKNMKRLLSSCKKSCFYPNMLNPISIIMEKLEKIVMLKEGDMAERIMAQ